MWQRFKDWLDTQSRVYPVRWYWPVIRIYGGPIGRTRECYMTRVVLFSSNNIGGLYLHFFHREDIDRDPHDHPFPFWTLPLNQGYSEDVFDIASNCYRVVHVPRWRITARRATHTHRVTGTDTGHWPLITLVWRGASERKWGFWCHTATQPRAERFWVRWETYLKNGSAMANKGDDDVCPGSTV